MTIESSKKVDDQSFEVVSSERVVRVYDIANLKSKRAVVEAQRAANDRESAAELAKIDELLAEAQKVGVVEPQPEPEVLEVGAADVGDAGEVVESKPAP